MATNHEVEHDTIAIVGMSCRVPGANDANAFWQMVVDRREGVTEYTGGRTAELDAFYQRTGMPGGPATKRGGFLQDIERFDAAFFEMSPIEAEWLDPQQRLLLETAWEALEDAGIPREALAGEKAGVFAGVWNNEYERHVTTNSPVANFFGITGTALFGVSSRVSYHLDLRGPDVSANAACASSLVAVHLAIRSLRSEECSVALAAGVNIVVRHEATQALSRARVLSPRGRCRFGDAGADGYVRSEGVGMLVLKRLSDARRDGDRILALIRGSAITNGGRTSGMLARPSSTGQSDAMVLALDDAGLKPDSVDFVEAHGTGTRIGDPIEIAAIAEVYGRRDPGLPCRIAAVKSNIGHTESASGVISMIRTVQALRKGRFPATLHVDEPNPAIDWATSGLKLELEGGAWERTNGAPRRAGVNGLGLTGTNVHVILEEAPEATQTQTEERKTYLLPLSAASGAALQQRLKDVSALLLAMEDQDGLSGAWTDLCFTASVRRSHLSHRIAVVGADGRELRKQLDEFSREHEFIDVDDRDRKPKIVFVFPGQGSQWAGMGRELLATYPSFRRSMKTLDAAIAHETGWSVLQQLEDPGLEDRLARIDVIQPTLFAVEVALSQLWMSFGVIPDAVVGHSMGEVAAACAAGILSVEVAAKIICQRSRLLLRAVGQGSMVVVDLSRGQAEILIAEHKDKISIAVCNSPRSTVLAGDRGVLEGVVSILEQQDVFCRWVRVDVASHSPQMDPLLGDLAEALVEVTSSSGSIPLYSTVEAGMIEPGSMNAAYWVKNLREPVLFTSAIEALLIQGFDTFLEMSPHPTLIQHIELTAESSGRAAHALGSLRRNEPEDQQLLTSVGRLYTAGVEINWRKIYGAGNLVDMPPYPWQRERFWVESTDTAGSSFHSGHPLMGEALKTATGEWIWSAKLNTELHPWLKDHGVGEAVLLPASALIELAGNAAQQIFGGETIAMDLMLKEAAVLSSEKPLQFQIVAIPENSDVFAFKFFHREDESYEWVATAECMVRRATPKVRERADVGLWEDAGLSRESTSGAHHAATMEAWGYSFGPAFQQIEWLALEKGNALARITLPEALQRESYLLHPAVLDAALQVLGRLLMEGHEPPQILLPVSCSAIEWSAISPASGFVYAAATAHDGALTGNVNLFDREGRVLVNIRDLAFHPLEKSEKEDLDHALYGIEWERLAEPKDEGDWAAAGQWLLIADGKGFADELAEALRRRGAQVSVALASQVLGDEVSPGEMLRGAVWLTPLDLDDTELGNTCQVLAEGAALVTRLGESADEHLRLWSITRGTQKAQQDGPVVNVPGAGVWGFFASVSNEYPMMQASCVDLSATPTEDEADLLATIFLEAGREDRIALRAQGMFGCRLQRSNADDVVTDCIPVDLLSVEGHERQGFELTQAVPGSLDSLKLVSRWSEPPDADEVEIQVTAAALNFRDVLLAMNLHEALAEGRFGGECAGTVLRVGSAVTRFRAGDAVFAISPSFQTTTLFASCVRVPEALVMHKPEQLGFAEAAGIPCVFLTAWYGLVKLAQLKKGERVLIHAAAGGVGLAAVQIAKWIGAEIFATVSSEEKRTYLAGLGVKHIMHSRRLDFSREILEATDGQGVDVVLNSLAGPAITAGLDTLAPYGRFIEIGKRDIWENSRIGLRPFIRNLSLFAVDLAQAVGDRREMVGTMFGELTSLFRQGVFVDAPTTVFPISQAGEAFRLMRTGNHIGKIVLDMQDAAAIVHRGPMRFSADANYLITGGLGGLGLVTAEAFVEQGARHLVLTSRRAASPEALQSLARMEAKGATVRVRPVNMNAAAEVRALLDELGTTGPPLRGIVHAAGVLDDAVVEHLTADKFESVLAAKVGGALTMDDGLERFKLDFLLYYSSAAGVLGTPGQANYAAANTMLDALAHRQRTRGIRATSIDWGTWAEVGLAAAVENRGDRLAKEGLKALTRREGVDLLMKILNQSRAQVVAMHLEADRWSSVHPAAARSPLLAALLRGTGDAAPTAGGLAATLGAMQEEERLKALVAWLRAEVASVLGLHVDRVPDNRPLHTLGMDSLLTLDLRNRMQRQLRLRIPTTLVWNYPTLLAIAAHLQGQLPHVRSKEAETVRESVDIVKELSPVLPARIEEAAEESIAAMLEAELQELGRSYQP